MSLIILCGKTSSGKDMIRNILVYTYGYKPIVNFTDRPMRKTEENGREYNFVSKDEFTKMINENKFIEYRTYHTSVKGISDTWRYGTRSINEDIDSVLIMTPEGINTIKDKLHNPKIFYIDSSYGTRHNRAILRGDYDETEWLRRRETDDADFSDDIINLLNPIKITNETGDDIFDIIKQIISFI